MNEPSVPKAGGLWARLFGVQSAADEPADDKPDTSDDLVVDEPTVVPSPPGAPVSAARVTLPEIEVADARPETAAAPAPPTLPPSAETPVPAPPALDLDLPELPPPSMPVVSPAPAVEEPPAAPAEPAATEAPPTEVPAPPTEAPAPAAALSPCPACGTPRKPKQRYCEDCGWLFSADDGPAAAPVAPAALESPATFSPQGADMPTTKTQVRLRDRYELAPDGQRTPGDAPLSRFRPHQRPGGRHRRHATGVRAADGRGRGRRAG